MLEAQTVLPVGKARLRVMWESRRPFAMRHIGVPGCGTAKITLVDQEALCTGCGTHFIDAPQYGKMSFHTSMEATDAVCHLRIEDALQTHPAVLLMAAVGSPDAYAGELPVAYVQLKPGTAVTEAELLEHAARTIPEKAAIPKRIKISSFCRPWRSESCSSRLWLSARSRKPFAPRRRESGPRIGAMTDKRWKDFYETMVNAGVVKADIVYTRAYTLQFVNKGVGVDLRPKN